MAMAVLVRQEEIWKIMTEYKEMPDEVKFMQLSMLMSGARSAMVRREPMEQFKKKFEEMLHSVSSLEMVGQKSFLIVQIGFDIIKGEHQKRAR